MNRTVAYFFLLIFTASISPALAFEGTPSKRLLNSKNHILILIDHQPQMAFATRSIDIGELRNNVTALAKSAKVFKGSCQNF